MCDVFLDGEKVEFSGPPPGSISEVRSALEDALAARGRVLAALTINGQPFDETLHDRIAGGMRVEAASLALAEALAQVGAGIAPDLQALRDRVQVLAHEVLCAPWSDMQPRCVEVVQSAAGLLQRAVEVASLSGEASAITRAVAALATTIEAWMTAMQAEDAAAVALRLDGEVVPALAQLVAALEGTAAS